ncbi:CCHC-type domain-containing protein [Heracleum sosnowskyi]|uniref:CCHC-type domain-containing protein n=1 Tax=Heracleum sosnowskyi TaxID=360622 RepID=A0AAD8GUH2_9APIA|nr:CCHC-type domain-containing protein [Heracleum sosnowskyi]
MSSTDSLIQSMNMVTIEDEEEIGYEIIAEEQEQPSQYFQGFNPKLCVVGRFIVEGKTDFLAFQHTMAALWKPGKGVYIKELDTNLFLFQFFHEVDIRRVMEGCPWSFNRRALVMSRLKDGENPRSVVLNSLELWVQVYDMKPGFMSEKILQGIGNYIGHHVSNCQSNFNGVWKEYMRIRVSINLNNPLRRRMKMKMNGEEWFWVNFRYENVPMFCFFCGIVGHSEKYCSKLFEHEAEEITKPYGPWLRAPFRGQVKPIGAKWLRTEMFNGKDNQSPETSKNCNEKSDRNLDPHFSPTNQENSYK